MQHNGDWLIFYLGLFGGRMADFGLSLHGGGDGYVYRYEFFGLIWFSRFMGMKFSIKFWVAMIFWVYGWYEFFFFFGIFWVVHELLCGDLCCSCICESALDGGEEIVVGLRIESLNIEREWEDKDWRKRERERERERERGQIEGNN